MTPRLSTPSLQICASGIGNLLPTGMKHCLSATGDLPRWSLAAPVKSEFRLTKTPSGPEKSAIETIQKARETSQKYGDCCSPANPKKPKHSLIELLFALRDACHPINHWATC